VALTVAAAAVASCAGGSDETSPTTQVQAEVPAPADEPASSTAEPAADPALGRSAACTDVEFSLMVCPSPAFPGFDNDEWAAAVDRIVYESYTGFGEGVVVGDDGQVGVRIRAQERCCDASSPCEDVDAATEAVTIRNTAGRYCTRLVTSAEEAYYVEAYEWMDNGDYGNPYTMVWFYHATDVAMTDRETVLATIETWS
jgi:hypothetical protein